MVGCKVSNHMQPVLMKLMGGKVFFDLCERASSMRYGVLYRLVHLRIPAKRVTLSSVTPTPYRKANASRYTRLVEPIWQENRIPSKVGRPTRQHNRTLRVAALIRDHGTQRARHYLHLCAPRIAAARRLGRQRMQRCTARTLTCPHMPLTDYSGLPSGVAQRYGKRRELQVKPQPQYEAKDSTSFAK